MARKRGGGNPQYATVVGELPTRHSFPRVSVTRSCFYGAPDPTDLLSVW
jgi:hypothetical protein